MVGVSAIGIYDNAEDAEGFLGLRMFSEYTNMERMMLDAILSECQSCITSEGRDCMVNSEITQCPFVEVRKTCGIVDIKCWK